MLNKRQIDLLQLVQYSVKIRIAMVCEFLPQHYHLGCANSKHTNTNCSLIYRDVDAINDDMDTNAIIIKENGCLKLATKEDAEKYAEKEWKRACHYLVTHSVIIKKMKLDGQYDIIKDQFHKIYKDDTL